MSWVPWLFYHGKHINKIQHWQNISINITHNFLHWPIENHVSRVTIWCPAVMLVFSYFLHHFLKNIVILILKKHLGLLD